MKLSITELSHDLSASLGAVRRNETTIIVTRFQEELIALVPIDEYRKLTAVSKLQNMEIG